MGADTVMAAEGPPSTPSAAIGSQAVDGRHKAGQDG
jgi:hypothetical protein